MVTITAEHWKGQSGYQIQNPVVHLFIPDRFGPRLLAFGFRGENILAENPDSKISVKGGKVFSLRGGHRLWYAPERPETTYLPDDQPPQIEEIGNGLECVQAVDEPTGIQKSWRLILDPESARLTIVHKLTNQGESSFELAPWAVTMLPPGGTALLPLPSQPVDEHGLWPNRQLVIWPYTDLTSPQLEITNRSLVVRAELSSGALKVGAPNPDGWIAYRRNEITFVKRTDFQEAAVYPDRGASHQIYCDPGVIELETLGPLVNLPSGEEIKHQEVWELYPTGNAPEEIHEGFG